MDILSVLDFHTDYMTKLTRNVFNFVMDYQIQDDQLLLMVKTRPASNLTRPKMVLLTQLL